MTICYVTVVAEKMQYNVLKTRHDEASRLASRNILICALHKCFGIGIRQKLSSELRL